MAKQVTNNQIREQVRKKVAKQYAEKLITLEKNLQEQKKFYSEASKNIKKIKDDNVKLKDENAELKERLASYEDWLNRMQDFCNLPEDERPDAYKKFKIEMKQKENLNKLMETYGKYFNMLFT